MSNNKEKLIEIEKIIQQDLNRTYFNCKKFDK